jgi:hypothetical protein
MAIHCLFFTPGSEKEPSCQVLRALRTPPLLARTQAQLEQRYCTSGAFIGCPIFARVEAGLTEANRLRPAASDRPSALCA